MGSQFSPEIQELLWKLHRCREEAVKLGFDSAGLLIRSAVSEIEDLAQLREAAAAAKRNPPVGKDRRA
jgi:hypothetical protein